MKPSRLFFLLILLYGTRLCAQNTQNTDLQLAQQYSANGNENNALEIYKKLYKQNNETFYSLYFNSLTALKQFDEAESITKKMLKKYPDNYKYSIALANTYRADGHADKAEDIYNDIIKNLPDDYNSIAALATQFYQAENADIAIRIFLQGRKHLHNEQAFAFELINLYRFKHDKAGLVNEYLNFLPLNPGYILSAENAMAAIFDGSTDYDMLKSALLKLIQQNPQQIVYTELLTWQYLQQKDFEQALNQALALSRRNNDNGENIFELCETLVANHAYDEAIRGYEYIINKSNKNQLYVASKIELINTKNLKITSGKYTITDLQALEKDYTDLLAEFGYHAGTAFAIQKLASLQAFKLHKLSQAQKLLEDALKIPGLNTNTLSAIKLQLGDIYLINNQPWEATLMYSQVEKNRQNNITTIQDAKMRNAKLSYYTGDFTWAKGQLDVLKVATSQLIANDALNLSLLIKDNTYPDTSGAALKLYARADLLIFKEEPDKAMQTLDSINTKFAGNTLADDILMAKAKIYLQQKQYDKAIIALNSIAQDHKFDLWADDAVFMLGDIYENNLHDKEKAKMYYQRIITNYPGSLWINEARKRFRILRGDKLNTPS